MAAIATGSDTPIEYFNVLSAAPEYLVNGTATLAFWLYNPRVTVAFTLTHSPGGVVAGSSNVVSFATPHAPHAVRLMLGATGTAMTLTWSGRGNASIRATGTSTWRNVSGASVTYSAADMCGPPANASGWMEPGWISTARVEELTPGNTYEYMVGCPDDGYTAVANFSMPSWSGATSLALYGDMGVAPVDGSNASNAMPPAPVVAARVASDVATGAVHAVAHIGDVAYAMGFASVWDDFISMIADVHSISSHVPYATLLGNHELLWDDDSSFGPPFYPGQADSGGECGIPATRQFPMPGPASMYDTHYSVRVGSVMLIAFSAEVDFTTGSVQWTFLRDAIAAVNRTATPWVVLLTHRPFYGDIINSSSPQASVRVAALLRQHVEPLFVDGQGRLLVDAVFGGHFHDYQRACASMNGTCVQRSVNGVYMQPAAPVHVLIGAAGAELSCCHNATTPEYTELTVSAHGHGRLIAHNSSALQWQFISADNGTVLDEAWVLK